MRIIKTENPNRIPRWKIACNFCQVSCLHFFLSCRYKLCMTKTKNCKPKLHSKMENHLQLLPVLLATHKACVDTLNVKVDVGGIQRSPLSSSSSPAAALLRHRGQVSGVDVNFVTRRTGRSHRALHSNRWAGVSKSE